MDEGTSEIVGGASYMSRVVLGPPLKPCRHDLPQHHHGHGGYEEGRHHMEAGMSRGAIAVHEHHALTFCRDYTGLFGLLKSV